jgi:hypothetical protein
MTDIEKSRDQLSQLAGAGIDGVWSGDLIDKTSTRWLVENGYASNTGGPPSSLKRVRITPKGRAAL